MESKTTRRDFLKKAAVMALPFPAANPGTIADILANEKDTPNIIIIFTDDQGYGDLGCYGHPTIRTPNIDRMAAEGTKFTQFYVAASVCTPSRAALLTGCYPKRLGLQYKVIFPDTPKGLNPDELTIAEMLKQKGYATACIGKWHLGHHKTFLPTRQGFDYFYGIPYSNDMSAKEQHKLGNMSYKFRLPVMKNEEIIEYEPDQRTFTGTFTDESVRFIKKNQKNPFFLYLAHPMPHIPLYASAKASGKSLRGLYGDVIEEIDAGVGRILDTLKSCKIEKNTLVIFTSDNGPWLSFKQNGGSAGLLKGGKATTYEGGFREPCIMYWPGTIPGGKVCMQMASAMDILPTIAVLTGTKPVPGRIIDGKNIAPLLKNPHKTLYGDREFIYFSNLGVPDAIRLGKWKYNNKDDTLIDLETDPSEKWDMKKDHPDIAETLKNRLMERNGRLNCRHVPRVPTSKNKDRYEVLHVSHCSLYAGYCILYE